MADNHLTIKLVIFLIWFMMVDNGKWSSARVGDSEWSFNEGRSQFQTSHGAARNSLERTLGFHWIFGTNQPSDGGWNPWLVGTHGFLQLPVMRRGCFARRSANCWWSKILPNGSNWDCMIPGGLWWIIIGNSCWVQSKIGNIVVKKRFMSTSDQSMPLPPPEQQAQQDQQATLGSPSYRIKPWHLWLFIWLKIIINNDPSWLIMASSNCW